MKPILKIRKETTLYIVLGIVLFIYLLIRAIFVPFSHDEASTFFHLVQPGNLMPEFSREALNNHFINTILTYLSYLLFGSSKIALRLPNLIFAMVYLVFVYRIARFLADGVYRWGFIFVMLFSHFFVEFFAVSRGYGISMALFMGAFYFLMKAIKTNKLTNHIFVSIFSLLMITANINLVIPAIAIVLFQILVIFIHREAIPNKQKWIIPLSLLISISSITAVFFYVNKLKEYDAFYLVPENVGFVNSTITTLITMLTGTYNIVDFIVVLALFALVVIISIRQLSRFKHKFLISISSIFLFVLVLSLVGIFLVVNLLDVNFPEDRVAMYLFPLAVGSLFFVIDSVEGRRSRFLYFAVIPLLFFPIHFVSSINVSYVNGYKTEALPERFYQTISLEHEKNNVIPTIGGSNMRHFAWAYMNYTNGGNENSIDWAGYPNTVSSFQILETNKYPYSLNDYDSIDYEACSGLTLYKRKQEVTIIKTHKISINSPQKVVGDEYFNILEIDTMDQKNYYFDFNLSIVAAELPITGWLVIQAVNSEHSTLVYKFMPLNWLKHGLPDIPFDFHQSIFMESLPEGVETIKIYIWNKDKKTFTLNSARVEVFDYE
ncbi:MAG: glycosyltransferase family 39 protein [Bacteroidetes bacterium]|nr:glycosyltransferase family 39 protein [Bacteroidota bacterium]